MKCSLRKRTGCQARHARPSPAQLTGKYSTGCKFVFWISAQSNSWYKLSALLSSSCKKKLLRSFPTLWMQPFFPPLHFQFPSGIAKLCKNATPHKRFCLTTIRKPVFFRKEEDDAFGNSQSHGCLLETHLPSRVHEHFINNQVRTWKRMQVIKTYPLSTESVILK